MPTQANTTIPLSSNRFEYETEVDAALAPHHSVLSPSGRTLFLRDIDDKRGFLAIRLMAGRSVYFRVFEQKEDENIEIHLQPIDDDHVFVAFERRNDDVDSYHELYNDNFSETSNDPDDNRTHTLLRFRLDYANEQLIRMGEWQCEMNGQELDCLDVRNAIPVRVLPLHYKSGQLHSSVYFFDQSAKRYRRIDVHFHEPNFSMYWSDVFFDNITSDLSQLRNGRFYAFSIRNIRGVSLPEFLDTSLKCLLQLDITTGRIEEVRVENRLSECLSNCADSLNPHGEFDADGHWMDDRFCLKLQVPRQNRSCALYFAVFELQTLRWRRLVVDVSMRSNLSIERRLKMCTIDRGVLVLYRENHDYKLVNKRIHGESAVFYLKSVDVFRMPLREPDSLKELTRLEMQRVYGRSWTKWQQILGIFRGLLE